MPGYMVYWPQDRVRELQKANDTGPIKVVFGSVHTRMPSITPIKKGDVVFPVTLMDKKLYVLARLPVEHKESAYDYLVRELGNRCAALVPDGVDRKLYYNTPLKPHMAHQEPFNCCSKHAVWGENGSSIRPRLVPEERLPELRFGYPKSKERGLRFDQEGKPVTNVIMTCLSSTKRLSPETWEIFESLFQDS